MASTSQRNSLQAEIQRLGQETDWNSMPILTGAKASERRASMWQQMEMDRKQQLAAAQAKLTAFDMEQSALLHTKPRRTHKWTRYAGASITPSI